MRIAVWDEPALDFFARAAEELAAHHKLTVVRLPRRPLRDTLVGGEVDIALLPTLSVFLDHELFDVLPAVAISSWDFPFLKLNLRKGIGQPIDSIWIDPSLAQEALVTKVILKEHYDLSPSFKPFVGDLAEAAKLQDLEGTLVKTTGNIPELKEGVSIDLGRDWFELTNYPMVWGLFAMRNGEASGRAVNIIRDIASYTELRREEWLAEEDMPEELHKFYKEGLRYRLDDLATASITSFQDYLYYNDAVDDMAPLPFYEVPEGEADGDDGPLL
ncbi:MAG: MqnA/MqnD/SBP family protein [Rhodothermales bacterium]